MTIKRGRPRPQSTIDRDAQVLAGLEDGPRSRSDLAAMAGVNVNVMYLTLCRLRDAGQVGTYRRGKQHLWMLHTHG